MSGLIGLAPAVALACTALPAAAAATAALTAVTFNLLHGGATSGLTGEDQELELRPDDTGATVWQRVEAPAPTASRRVDFMFLVPGTQYTAEVRSSRVVINAPRHLSDGRTLWPSDHYGVLGEMVIVPRSQSARP